MDWPGAHESGQKVVISWTPLYRILRLLLPFSENRESQETATEKWPKFGIQLTLATR